MYKYEAHMHTFEISKCGKTCAKDYIKKFKEMGYDGIFITDHFYHGNCRIDRDLPWDKFVDEYAKGYELAKEEGDKIGLKVFFGIEESFLDDCIDYLVYGIDKEFLKKHPELRNVSRREFVKIMHDAGAIIIHAHPFRDAHYINKITIVPDEPDAIEVINVHQKPISNVLAKKYVDKYNFKTTCGTDLHDINTIKDDLAWIEYEKPLNSVNDYVDRIKEGNLPKLNYYTNRIDEPLRNDLKKYLIENDTKKEIDLNCFFN